MNENLLHLTDVSKSFGEVNAIEHVSLDIKDRSVIGLVGGNGAGKTTLLRMMAGIYKPTTGRVYLKDGQSVDQMRSLLGVVPESTGRSATDRCAWPDAGVRWGETPNTCDLPP